MRTDRAGDDHTGAAIVADVAHALRNHYHRLYYWVDVLDAERLSDDARSALTSAAETLRSIERLTNGVMALSRALDLTLVTMPVGEMTTGIARALERRGATVEVERGTSDDVSLAIDPGYVSRTIEIVHERLGGSNPGPIELRVDGDDEAWVVFRLHAVGVGDEGEDDVERLVAWAEGERVLAAHGGRLLWEAAGPDERRAVLLLPRRK